MIYSTLMSHEPVDLLIIMLGTNDTKDRLGANPACIGAGMERLVTKAKQIRCWRNGVPHILVVAPPHIGEGLNALPDAEMMGVNCPEKSRGLAEKFRRVCDAQGCAFLDAEGIAEFNQIDFMHLTRKGHGQLAEALAQLIRSQEI